MTTRAATDAARAKVIADALAIINHAEALQNAESDSSQDPFFWGEGHTVAFAILEAAVHARAGLTFEGLRDAVAALLRHVSVPGLRAAQDAIRDHERFCEDQAVRHQLAHAIAAERDITFDAALDMLDNDADATRETRAA